MLTASQTLSLSPKQRQSLQALVLRRPTLPRTLERYRNDPVGFVREVLGVEPWETQEAIMRSVAEHPRTTVRSCHGSGKTFAAAALVHWWTRCFEPSLVITTAPTLRQVKDVLWQEVRQQQGRAKLAGAINTQDLTVSPTQRALGFTTSEPEKFQGHHAANILVVVDEASGVDEAIYEAIEGILTGPNAHLLLIGNPNNPSGAFFESFRSDLYREGRFHISAYDVPERLLPAGWAAERLAEWGAESSMYQVRVLGNFPDRGDDSLIAMTWAEAAKERDGTDQRAGAVVELGADIARFGADESVLCVRRGDVVVALAAWRGLDTVASAGRIAAAAHQWGAAVIKVDDIGVGGGVTDQLSQTFAGTDVAVIGVNVGEAAWDSEMFQRRRDELWWGLRQRFVDGDISIPDDDILLSQLTTIRYGYTPRGQIKVESKDEMRKRRASNQKWQSPDRGDACMLAFAECGNRFVPWSLVGEARPM